MMILKRSDGAEIEVSFHEPEPEIILIKATTYSGNSTPLITDHDRIDWNMRQRMPWESRMSIWLKSEMEKFSEGKSVIAFHYNPYFSIAGYVPYV